uniref:GT23 domain-containing protein n=2 Tax=Aplanochytrium stocchinoi TaxID=215587 RepID=A0A7S3LLF9_9STRA|mmetsp:Transcript_30483/g.37733  ORF Transcript_30483/g.37733 Transcript_30483/m.37733 type:complete len:219 (+) Transcript_30483:146-802(+)
MYETAIARALLGRYVPEYYVRSIRPRVEALSKELGSTTQCIGMHIRHGDTCINPDRGCRKLREYMRAAKMLKYKYNVSKIYLATDDPHVESALHKPKKYIYTYRRHFPAIVMQNISRRAFDFSNYSMLKDVDTATYPENRVKHLGSRPVTEFLVDIHMLRSCDYFVGTISSGIGRVVLALISSRLGRIPPFISLQEGLNRDGIFAVPGHKNTRRVNPT